MLAYALITKFLLGKIMSFTFFMQGKKSDDLNIPKNVRMQICLFMAALHSRCRHYVFVLWFPLSSSSFFFFLA